MPPEAPELTLEPIPPPPPNDWSSNAGALLPKVLTVSWAGELLVAKLTVPASPPEPPVPPMPAEAPKENWALDEVVLELVTAPALPPPPPRLCSVIAAEDSPRVMTSIGVRAVRLTLPPAPPLPPRPPRLTATDPEILLPPDAEASLMEEPPTPPPPPTDCRNRPSEDAPRVATLPP